MPDDTAQVARAAFPRGNLYLRLYDALGSLFADRDFAALFPTRGQPAEAPVRLALATILQFREGLSDRRLPTRCVAGSTGNTSCVWS